MKLYAHVLFSSFSTLLDAGNKKVFFSLTFQTHGPEDELRGSVGVIPASYPKFPRFNFDQETSCPDLRLSSFSSVALGKFRDSTSPPLTTFPIRYPLVALSLGHMYVRSKVLKRRDVKNTK
jgi:hypothetical protein